MITVLIGAGGHAKVVYDIASSNGIQLDGFIDPNVEKFYSLKKMDEDVPCTHYFISVGATNIKQICNRQELYLRYKSHSKPISLISSSSIISPKAHIGQGSFVSHNVTINAGAKIGENVIINTGAIIEHDVVIEDGVHIAPGSIILGGARIEKMSMIGAASIILPSQIVPEKFLVSAFTRYKNV